MLRTFSNAALSACCTVARGCSTASWNEFKFSLKQGAGRLIRDVDDYGVLMLCDPRLISKPYGKLFIRSLPPMKRTRKLAEVEAFYAHYAQRTSLEATES